MAQIPPRLGFVLNAWRTLIVAISAAQVLAKSDTVSSSRSWKVGDVVPVTCLNRTLETGEHVTDTHGDLQYISSFTCDETGKPLALSYFSSAAVNCSLTVSDPMFHMLEYYIHNDVPLTCRIPSSPASSGLSAAAISGEDRTGAIGSESNSFTPLVVALSGTLQLSHVHIANRLNFVMHTAPSAKHLSKREQVALKNIGLDDSSIAPGIITSAAAYSVSPLTQNSRLVIGDTLTLQILPRWYTGSLLPPSSASPLAAPVSALPSHHNLWSTLVYCIISAAASATICVVYFRGVDLPRRLRFHGNNRIGGWSNSKRQELPVYKGYGYNVGITTSSNGIGNGGYGYSVSTGKRD